MPYPLKARGVRNQAEKQGKGEALPYVLMRFPPEADREVAREVKEALAGGAEKSEEIGKQPRKPIKGTISS